MKGRKLSNKERREKLEKDKEYRRAVFKELCDHLSKGYSLDCFSALSDKSVLEYLKLYPEEFIQEEMQDSMRKGKVLWEGIGYRQAVGECLGNSRSWYYNMSNRYGWKDKVDVEAEHKGQVSVNIVSYASQQCSNIGKEDVAT